MPHCLTCDRVLPPTPYYLPPKKQRARRYCGRKCFGKAMQLRGMALVGATPVDLEPPDSPARVPTWREVPRTCPQCGGLWRYAADSVQCRQCGRDVWVIAALPS